MIYKPWFEALQFVRRRTFLSTVLAWFTFQANQLIFGPGQAQVRRECVETVNQVSYLTSQCQWNVRILSVILCGASCLKRFPWLAYSKYLDGAFCLLCFVFFVVVVFWEVSLVWAKLE